MLTSKARSDAVWVSYEYGAARVGALRHLETNFIGHDPSPGYGTASVLDSRERRSAWASLARRFRALGLTEDGK